MTQNTQEHTSSAYTYPLLIGDLLTAGVAQVPTQEIVYGNDYRLTYQQLQERVHRLASGLTHLGVKPGSRVAVMDWDSHRYLECFFAIPMLGAVLHMVNVRLSPEQILYTLNHAEAEILLVNREFLPLLEAIRERLETVKTFVLLEDNDQPLHTPLALTTEYEALLKTGDPHHVFSDFSEETWATLFYTSGTTGLPKGVSFTHRQLVLHTFAARSALAGIGQGLFNGDDVYMPMTPMFHVHAWGCPYLATLLGTKQVYPGRYQPETLLGLIQQEGVTFSHCVPTLLRMLLSHPKRKTVVLSRCKIVIGGAALPRSLASQALDVGIDIFAGYGLSETCPILTLSQLKPEMRTGDRERQLAVRCQAGHPFPLVKLRIVDEHMKDQPHDGQSQGEVVVRAPWLTPGYLKDPEGSEALWRGGWLHTGDIGTLDAEGHLNITDRLKDVIKSGGEWISSLDLENLILTHPALAEAAVIGVTDPNWGERPLALVVVKPDQNGQVNAADIKALLNQYANQGLISQYAVPDRILLVESLPKTSVGKLDKKLLRQQYKS
ncbi:fatty acid--CoA ligase [Nitrosococcus wardiae]|uniref:Fatty acid--CoA ligase n=1 Tax=Nitrosococcus wardiae TaxID=1814290 RepID=A0A4P7C189_9GAMM|nr:fatty acid--CoA ligase [Nitrosococcus wardiae]QBQ56348.1 fatty acid--CoA ligase [Nitrosococcus wardiae]